MPWNQPHRNSSTNITAMLDVAQGTKPINNITAAARISPAGRKTRGFERSETEPMMNFENPKEQIDPVYRRLRWQIFMGIFFGYAAYYLVRKNFTLAMPRAQSP